MRPQPSVVNSLYSAILWLFSVGVLVLGNATNGAAQQNGVSSPARGFYPAGSYALSDLESISTRNGNVTMQVPLVSLPPGRGGLSAKLGLFYNSKIWESYSTPGLDMDGNPAMYQYLRASPEAGWRYGLNYSLTLLNLSDYQPNDGVCSPAYYEKYYIYKLQMNFPDGSTHLFHSRAYSEYGGYSRMRPDGWQHDCSVFPPPGDLPFDTGTMVYYTDDGSYVRLEVAHDGDTNWSNNPWTLYMPDGSRVTGGNSPQRIYDRNNNYVEIRNTVSNNNPATEVVDQLGRALKIEYDSNNSRDYVTQRGTNNVELKWTLDWEYLPVYKTHWAVAIISGGIEAQSATNESIYLVRRITLPVQAGSQTYDFSYNADPATQINGWGELRSMTLPTGAKVTYSYQYDGVDLSNSNIRYLEVLANSPTQKVLTYTNEYDGATSPATETWTYNAIRDPTFLQTAFKTFERTSLDGGITRDRFLEGVTGPIPGPYRVENPNGSIVERSYRDQALVDTPGEVGTGTQHPPHGNQYLKTEFRSVSDASGNPTLTAIKDYNYDKNGNLTGASEYDWVAYTSIPRDGSGKTTGAIPGGATLKKTITNRYYNQTPDASDTTSNDPSIYYNSSAPQLRIALAWNEVSNGAQTLARTELVYDNPSTTGNVTQTTSWDSAKGSYSNPLTTNNSISTSTQYNQYGSPTLSTDPKGYQTQFSYGIVGAVIDLYPTQIKTAYGTSVQRTETREYDFYTALVTLVTDADNNVSSSKAYDVFGRPTLVRAAKDKPEETRSTTEYADTSHCTLRSEFCWRRKAGVDSTL